MSDLSPESADLALARHLLTTHALTALVETDLSLRRALVEVSRALDGAGASLDERLLASVAISDALNPLRAAIAVLRAGACRCGSDRRISLDVGANGAVLPDAVDSAQSVQSRSDAKTPTKPAGGSAPLRKLVLVRRRSTADCFIAATDDGRDPEGAA